MCDRKLPERKRKKKGGMKFGIRKINQEFHKQQSQSSQCMCAFVVVASPTRTAAAPFTHPGPPCACGFLGSLPVLTCQPSFPALLPSQGLQQLRAPCPLLDGASPSRLTSLPRQFSETCEVSVFLGLISLFQMWLKLATVFKSN